jgi:hypothetical protein
MVIHDLDTVRPGVSPDKADAPLVVDPDAVLSRPIAFEDFEPAARRAARSRNASALCNWRSLRCATRWTSAPIRRAKRPWNSASASRSAKQRIIQRCMHAPRYERQAGIWSGSAAGRAMRSVGPGVIRAGGAARAWHFNTEEAETRRDRREAVFDPCRADGPGPGTRQGPGASSLRPLRVSASSVLRSQPHAASAARDSQWTAART